MQTTQSKPEFVIGQARPDQIAHLTGLEQLNAMLAGALPAPSMAETLNFVISRVAEGEAEFRGTPTGAFLNPMGIVHGGWIMTLLDSALGCAVHTTIAPGESYVSLDTDVKFVKAITPASGEIIVTAKVQTRGRQIATSEGRAVDSSGRVLALGTSSCLIRPAAS
ncbi:phenylacetic acid degradation protein [Oceanicola sp. 22II-s10i]|uniref:PaaI family thioesterase n=1 Tax=Oceanicola sp. 22II-s10i TaxID=1317116 RepID=UPI000B520F53|nr:PaaI family thioesterase [Oceanicola sp. 22II-s10i]OWU86601.1 phenylacetic acid degradation protein [Oceanicola sp. 22II-s10i]